MNLIQKLAAIRQQIEGVAKKGKNTFQNYKYVMASDIAGELGTALAEHNIIVARRNLKVTHLPPPPPVLVDGKWESGQKNTIVLMECEYGFIDGDSDQELWQPAWGEGRDTGDKAGYKAFTGMLKYFLLQAFLLATGDDPEADSPEGDRKAETKKPETKIVVKPDAAKVDPKSLEPASTDQIKELLQLCEDTQTEADKVPAAFDATWDTMTVGVYEKAKAILLKRVQKRAEAAANA